MKTNFRTLVWVAGLDAVWFVLGMAGAKWVVGGRWSLAVALGLIGITTFFGVLLSGHGKKGTITVADGETRTAITVTMVIVYVSLLGMFVPSDWNPGEGTFTRSLVSQFDTLLVLVVGFYFATTGAVQAFKIAKGEPEAAPNQESETSDTGGGAVGGEAEPAASDETTDPPPTTTS